MNIIVFEQWDKLVAMFRNLAGSAATQKSQYDLNRIMPIDGKASLEHRAMKAPALDGARVTGLSRARRCDGRVLCQVHGM